MVSMFSCVFDTPKIKKLYMTSLNYLEISTNFSNTQICICTNFSYICYISTCYCEKLSKAGKEWFEPEREGQTTFGNSYPKDYALFSN